MIDQTNGVIHSGKAPDDLADSEIRYRRLFESARDGILILDAATSKITDVNPFMAEFLGYSQDEFLGKELWEIGLFKDKSESQSAFRKLQATGYIRYEDMPLLTKSGKRWDVEFISNVYQENDHQVIQCNIRDITERKQKDRALQESEETFHQLVNHITDAFWIRSPDMRTIHYLSPAFEQIWGRSVKSLLSNPHQWTDFILPEDREHVIAVFALLTRATPTISVEYRIVRPDGEIRWVHARGFQVRNEANELIRLTGVVTDITERKRAELKHTLLLAELESERARLADIFTHAPAFIASFRGPEHIFELANAHYYKLVGQRDLLGRRVRDALPEVNGQVFFELLDNVYATGRPFVGEEMPVEVAVEEGGPVELHYINFIYQPLKGFEGAVEGIICHGVDVTEQVLSRRKLQEAEGQLRQSQRLESIGMLAGGIAHDFNNLLTVIIGYSQITLMKLDKVDPLARNIEEIRKAADRAASLTSQLLAFSRKQVLQPKVLDLNSIIANVEKMLRRLVGEDLELHTLLDAGLGQIKADPGQIEQVIVNLVVNTRDAMPKGGKITIETGNIHLDEDYANRHLAVQPGWYAMLAVSDTGHGMDSETLKHIFEPFFTTKEQGKGTGLGLATVYGIVKQSGGHIWVYSEVGVGTTFKIYLPLVNEQVTKPEAKVVRPESYAGTETILLVEDEEIVRKLAMAILRMSGYTVLEAANAREAMLIFLEHKESIHLMLTDVVMPQMSGKELSDQIARLRADLPVLYMSGYTGQTIVHHGILDEDVAFIEKPFKPDELVRKVREVIDSAAMK